MRIRTLLRHFDFDVVSVHLDLIAGHPLIRRRREYSAGRDVVSGPVPRARDHRALDVAFAQRPAPVGARVADGIIRAVDVEQASSLIPQPSAEIAFAQVGEDGDDPGPWGLPSDLNRGLEVGA